MTIKAINNKNTLIIWVNPRLEKTIEEALKIINSKNEGVKIENNGVLEILEKIPDANIYNPKRTYYYIKFDRVFTVFRFGRVYDRLLNNIQG